MSVSDICATKLTKVQNKLTYGRAGILYSSRSAETVRNNIGIVPILSLHLRPRKRSSLDLVTVAFCEWVCMPLSPKKLPSPFLRLTRRGHGLGRGIPPNDVILVLEWLAEERHRPFSSKCRGAHGEARANLHQALNNLNAKTAG